MEFRRLFRVRTIILESGVFFVFGLLFQGSDYYFRVRTVVRTSIFGFGPIILELGLVFEGSDAGLAFVIQGKSFVVQGKAALNHEAGNHERLIGPGKTNDWP